MTYKIVRYFLNDDAPDHRSIVREGLTFEQVLQYCRSPEVSSVTCTKMENIRRSKIYGHWFDGYEECV